tara:strand:- start:4098 stop:5267 length:1170 start_codon:yes stop_codon:yes gene_type:complete
MGTEDVIAALSEARQLAEADSIIDAIERYNSILEISKDNATAWYCLGVLYNQTGDDEKAITAFESSDKIFPNHGPTLCNLAILLQTTDPQRANEYALAAMVQYPDDERLREISENLANGRDEPEKIFLESHPIVEDSSQLEGNFSDHYSLEDEARELTEKGDHAAAVAIWKGIMTNSPKSPEVWRGLADALLEAGYPDRYEQCIRRAETLEDENSNIIDHTPVEEPTISLVDAVENVREKEENSSEPRGDIDEAIGWFNMGTNLLNEGNNEEALTCFEKAIGGCPKEEAELRMKAQNGRGNALYNSGRFAESVVAYHTAISMDPTNVSGRTLFNMGSSYAAVEMYDDAIKCFNQALGRGLEKSELDLCERQISRCRLLSREQAKRQSRY